MKYFYILFTLLVLLLFQACSEDGLTPSEPYHTFAPEVSDTSEEAQLRREFFNNNGFYILFNDTLRHTFVGTDSQGDPVYQIETVDPGWSIFGYDGVTKYEFAYFKTMLEKQQRAEFVANLAKSMKEHNLTQPYSVLVVDTISVIASDGSTTHPDFLNSLRCFIIATSDLDQLDEMILLANMAGSGIAIKYENDLQDFYNLTVDMWGDPIYGTWKTWGVGDDMDHYYQLGILVNTDPIFYCSKGEDIAAYIHLLLTKSEEEILKEFAKYEKVLQKYAIMKEVAIKANIKF